MKNIIKKKLIIGTANFGLKYGLSNDYKKLKNSNIKKILNYAKKNNLNFFDTSNMYGDAEEKLSLLSKNNFKIITKVKITKKNFVEIYDEILNQVKNSLKVLRKNKLYAVLIHNTIYLKNYQLNLAFKSLYKLKKRGLILKIGFSTYGDCKIQNLLGKHKLDIIQTSINALDQLALKPKLIKLYKKKKVEVHARSIFLQGLLLKKNIKLPLNIKSLWKKNMHKWFDLCMQKKTKPLVMALSIVLNTNINKIIIGVDSIKQIDEILNSKLVDYLQKEIKFKKKELMINPYLWK